MIWKNEFQVSSVLPQLTQRAHKNGGDLARPSSEIAEENEM